MSQIPTQNKITLQEVIPPPIIFETSGPREHGDLKEKVQNRSSHCPHCGLNIER